MLERSERLRDCDANILPVLCRLQELTQDVNIVVILCSTLPVDKFRASTGFMEPIAFHFPQYTKGRAGHCFLLVDVDSALRYKETEMFFVIFSPEVFMTLHEVL